MDTTKARTWLYASIVAIPVGGILGFLHGGIGLAVMILGWIGVLFFEGPANGKANFGATLDPQSPKP